jgi:hypothetical protein
LQYLNFDSDFIARMDIILSGSGGITSVDFEQPFVRTGNLVVETEVYGQTSDIDSGYYLNTAFV